MMIYKPSKFIYSIVHIDRVHHFIRDHFSRIPLYTYISFNLTDPSLQNAGPVHRHLGKRGRRELRFWSKKRIFGKRGRLQRFSILVHINHIP